MAKTKTAMVAPYPSKAKDENLKLAELLAMFGNDRPYTLIRYNANNWKVLFLGDSFPTIIKLEDGKPVMTKLTE